MTNDNQEGRLAFFRKTEPANDHDVPDEPAIRLPPVVKALALAMIAVCLLQEILPEALAEEFVFSFGFVPARYTGGLDFGWQALVSPVTHMFLHGGWLHLFMNVTMLAAFGAALEKALGGKKMLVLFFLGGIFSVIFHFLFYPHMSYVMIGASGAISALFGAAVMLMQKQGILGQGRKALAVFIGVWVMISLFFGFFGVPGAEGPVAWTAHIGGFIAGLFLLRPVAAFEKT